MKRIFMLLALCVSAFLATALQAQSSHIRINLPYATQVGEKTLSAGEYDMNIISSGGDTPLLKIQSKESSVLVLVNRFTAANGANGKAEALLNHDDRGYRLMKVIVGDQGFELLQCIRLLAFGSFG